MSPAEKGLRIAGLVLAVPAAAGILWADVWLAFLLAFWVDGLVGGTESASAMLGFIAFVVLVILEVLALIASLGILSVKGTK